MANISMANWREKSKSENKKSTQTAKTNVEPLPKGATVATLKVFNNPRAKTFPVRDIKEMEDLKDVTNKEEYFYYIICDDILWYPKFVLYYEGVENAKVLTTRNLRNEASNGIPVDDILSKYSNICVVDIIVQPSKKLDGVCYYYLQSDNKFAINIFFTVNYTHYNQIYYDYDDFSNGNEFETIYNMLSKIYSTGLFLVLSEESINEECLKGKDLLGWIYGFEAGVKYNEEKCSAKLFLGCSAEEAKSKLDDMYDSDYLKGNKIIIDKDGNLREFK